MSDPPTYDQDLLSRLNALKKSSVILKASKPIVQPSQQTNPENDLSARLRSLRNASSSASPPSVPSPPVIESLAFPSIPATVAEDFDSLRNSLDVDDRTLNELLADLGPEDQWTLNPDDPKDIQKLLDEAKITLPRNEVKTDSTYEERKDQSRAVRSSRPSKEYLTRDIDMSVFALDDDDGGDDKGKARNSRLEDDSREAQEIVARLLDEVNFEKANAPPEPDQFKEESDNSEKEGDKYRGHSLPSAPSSLPEPPKTVEPGKKSLDFESDIAARMAALKGLGSTNKLGLPSAPKFKPADRPAKGLMKKSFTDEEVDSWCVICQDDATVKCLGCDGDLFCARCWKEGHMGPDAGGEEKRHKWTKYKKPN